MAQVSAYCGAGETPQYQFGFAGLKTQLGSLMGEAVECEHVNPANGDTLQTTTRGLAYYRKLANTPVFTDGYHHWGLTANGLVAWNGAIDPPPDALAEDHPDLSARLDGLRDQPGALAAPATLRPFSLYPLTLVQPGGSDIGDYTLVYGDGEADGAVIRGGSGRDLFDAVDISPEALCSIEDLYCQEGPLAPGGQPTAERLRGLLVDGHPAVVVHTTCCGANRWTIAWHDASSDASYAITLVGSAAQPYGDAVSPLNNDSARALSTLAAALTPVE